MFVFAAGYAGTTANLQIVLNTPKTLLKSCHPKKYLLNIPPPKKSWNRKFQSPQNPSIIPVTLNPEYLPPRPGPEVPVILICEMKMETITGNNHRKCES